MNPSPYLLRFSGLASQLWTCPSTTKYFSPSFSYKRSPLPTKRHCRPTRNRRITPFYRRSSPFRDPIYLAVPVNQGTSMWQSSGLPLQGREEHLFLSPQSYLSSQKDS